MYIECSLKKWYIFTISPSSNTVLHLKFCWKHVAIYTEFSFKQVKWNATCFFLHFWIDDKIVWCCTGTISVWYFWLFTLKNVFFFYYNSLSGTFHLARSLSPGKIEHTPSIGGRLGAVAVGGRANDFPTYNRTVYFKKALTPSFE